MARRKTPVPQLEWMRAKKDETTCANRRTWESRCRRYKVQESVGKFIDMETVYYALWLRSVGWEILSRHRKRSTAAAACETKERSRKDEVPT